MWEPSASPSLIAHSTALRFITGRVPGRARSTGLAWVLGSAPKAVGAAENLDLRGQLGVGFKADDDFVAVDQFGSHVMCRPCCINAVLSVRAALEFVVFLASER